MILRNRWWLASMIALIVAVFAYSAFINMMPG
jgi:hypothetical protein